MLKHKKSVCFIKGLEGNAFARSFTPWLLCSRYLKSRSIDQELEEAPVWHKVLAARALGMLFSFSEELRNWALNKGFTLNLM